jgi:RNA polymerase sigma factor (TIGR02999 family)
VSDPGLSPSGLFPAVYGELRRIAAARMAGERAGHTLDATALVHEAYLRLAGSPGFADRAHFLRAAAEAMRRILVDHARRRSSAKRGGGRRFELAEADRMALPDPETLLAIDEALGALAAEDPDAAELARLRLFAGLSVDEAAEALGVSRATGFRDWAYARAYLTAALTGG